MSLGTDFSTTQGFQWVPITTKLYYGVTISGMSVAGQSLGSASIFNSNGQSAGTIVDSGTTLMLLPKSAYAAYGSYLGSQCSKGTQLAGLCNPAPSDGSTILDGGLCYTMSDSQVNAYPSLTVDFGSGIVMTVSPQKYLFPFNDNGVTYRCMGLANLTNDGEMILGDVFMQNWHVVFDRQHSQIGFGPVSSCPGGDMNSSTNQGAVVVINSILFLGLILCSMFM